jgi:MFS family permease
MSTTRSAAAPVAQAVTRTGRRRPGVALFVIAAAQLMVVLDTTAVNVALPHIQHALGFSGTGLEWVVNAYALTFGGLMLLGGRAGDLFGRRAMLMAGLALFTAASLAGGLATSQGWLLAARAVQGAGAAVVAPTALALITTTFPAGPQRNRAFAVAAAGGTVGLIAGGRLTSAASDNVRPSRSRPCPYRAYLSVLNCPRRVRHAGSCDATSLRTR